MPTQQDFLPFAAAAGSNVLSQSAYAAASATSTGYVSGIASSAALNKSWRQSSIIASMIGDYIVQQVNQPVVDDGTKTTILANFTASIQSMIDAVSNVVISVTGGTATLTTAQAKNKVISFSGTLTSPAVIVFPTAFQFWEILNNTTGSFSLTCKTALGSGVTVKQGGIASRIFCDNIGIQFVQNEAITVAQFDNSQAFATTAFVQRAIGSFTSNLSTSISNALTAANIGQEIIVGTSGTTQTLPPVASVPSGAAITFSAYGNCTIKGNAAEAIINPYNVSANTFAIKAGEQIQLSSDGTRWQITQYSAVTGKLLAIQTFIASGTYTPTPGTATAVMRVQAGGGCGGGATIPAAGNISLGAPGGAGSYGEGVFTAAAIGASQAVTVGAGGTSPGAAAGNPGGTSSVGALISAGGGSGGSVLNNQAVPITNGNGVMATAPSGGNIISVSGTSTYLSVAINASVAYGGNGGASIFGSGGAGGSINTGAGAGVAYGSGGGGVAINSGGSAAGGGAGKAGIVIIYDYA